MREQLVIESHGKRDLNQMRSLRLPSEDPKLGFNVPFNSQGHIGTGPQHCHLWDSNSQR